MKFLKSPNIGFATDLLEGKRADIHRNGLEIGVSSECLKILGKLRTVCNRHFPGRER